MSAALALAGTRRLLTLTAGLLACVFSAGLVGAAPPRLGPGVFLYASPGLADPNFVESVVLVLAHGAEGSMGVIVNRPTRLRVREAVSQLAEIRGLELRLNWGGPVQPDVMQALVRSPPRADAPRRVLPDVYLSADTDHWREVARGPAGPKHLRVYAGYAGWAAGQLARELRLGSWVVGRADAGSVFSSDPSALWPRVHALMGRIEARGGSGTDQGGLLQRPEGGSRRSSGDHAGLAIAISD